MARRGPGGVREVARRVPQEAEHPLIRGFLVKGVTARCRTDLKSERVRTTGQDDVAVVT